MSYEPTNWKRSDKVTSTRLNKIEQGIQGNDTRASTLMEDFNDMRIASASDVGKALKAKTVTDGKVVEWEFGEASADTTYSISINNNVITLTDSNGQTSSVTLPVYSGGVA